MSIGMLPSSCVLLFYFSFRFITTCFSLRTVYCMMIDTKHSSSEPLLEVLNDPYRIHLSLLSDTQYTPNLLLPCYSSLLCGLELTGWFTDLRFAS
ncbi:hypothetical protein BJ508DRAFT_76900 [Ascobolus immersus RN42]|uniref:Uncharacterized protein n=1 Tax=Ascobolus immersus RN42 TaxID=1160509 RepID=A0A3N4HRD3_ASCIM|nr:hypothetical protein BJ508DRAFT_76900 [Ascobolus immersus RN42]